MAQSERQREDRLDAKAKARRAKLESITQQRQALAFNTFPWAEFLDAVRVVVEHGGAIRIGQSRDGGAWAFGIYGTGETVTLYVNENDDPFRVIDQIKAAFDD